MTVVKIYASATVYAAMLAMVRHYCLEPYFIVLGVFCLTFLLIYQALYQHRLTGAKDLAIALGIALLMACLGFGTLLFWGYNYFTAAIFLTVCYNFFWGIFHYHLDRSLTWVAFWEILVISLMIASLVLSVTNFRARILDGCNYF